MKIQIMTCLAFLFLISHATVAQNAEAEGEGLEGMFYDPEFIMKHQKAINLTKEQRKSIIKRAVEAQGETGEMHWLVLDKMDDLREMVDQDGIDEDKTIALLEELLSIENKIKKAQLLLMVRIKNILSAEQKKLLDEQRK